MTIDLLQTIYLFIAGLVAGMYGSIIGGGGLIGFPSLILIGVGTETAIATGRFNAVFMEGSSVVAFARKKLVRWRQALPLALIAVPTSILGARIVTSINETFVNTIVALILVSLLFLLPRIKSSQKEDTKIINSRSNFMKMAFLVFALALYGGFYGAGFGTMIMFPLLIFGGNTLLESSGGARLIGLFMSVAASVVFISNGLVDFSLALPQLLGGIIGAQIGVHFADKIDAKKIKLALGAVILISVAKLLLEAFL